MSINDYQNLQNQVAGNNNCPPNFPQKGGYNYTGQYQNPPNNQNPYNNTNYYNQPNAYSGTNPYGNTNAYGNPGGCHTPNAYRNPNTFANQNPYAGQNPYPYNQFNYTNRYDKSTNVMGILSLVFSVISVFLLAIFFILDGGSVCFCASPIFAVTGFVLGIMSMRRNSRQNAFGIIGIVVSSVTAAIFIFMVLLVLFVISLIMHSMI